MTEVTLAGNTQLHAPVSSLVFSPIAKRPRRHALPVMQAHPNIRSLGQQSNYNTLKLTASTHNTRTATAPMM